MLKEMEELATEKAEEYMSMDASAARMNSAELKNEVISRCVPIVPKSPPTLSVHRVSLPPHPPVLCASEEDSLSCQPEDGESSM